MNEVDFLRDSGYFSADTLALHKVSSIAQQCRYANEKNVTLIPYECDIFGFAEDWKRNTTGQECLNLYNIKQKCRQTKPQKDAMASYMNVNLIDLISIFLNIILTYSCYTEK